MQDVEHKYLIELAIIHLQCSYVRCQLLMKHSNVKKERTWPSSEVTKRQVVRAVCGVKSVVGLPALYNGLTNIPNDHKNACVRRHSEAEGKVGQVRNFREDFLVLPVEICCSARVALISTHLQFATDTPHSPRTFNQ